MHEKSSDHFGLHDHLMGTGEFSGGKVPGQPLHCAYIGSHETYETARDIQRLYQASMPETTTQRFPIS